MSYKYSISSFEAYKLVKKTKCMDTKVKQNANLIGNV